MTGAGRNLLSIPMLVALLLLLPGCSEDETTCPSSPVGIVFGEMTAAGEPIEAMVSARGVPSADEIYSGFQSRVQTDSLGRYQIELPSGRFILNVSVQQAGSGYLHDGRLSETDADTVTVVEGQEPIRMDLELGSLTVRIEAPPELEGEEIALEVDKPDGRWGVRPQVGEVSDGAVEVHFPAVNEGTYYLRATMLRSGDAFWLPPTYRQTEAVEITVTRGEPVTYETTIPTPAKLTGTIRGSWMELDADQPRLRMFNSDSKQIGSWRASDDGEFEMRVYETIRARLQSSIEGTVAWYGGVDYESATELDLTLGEESRIEIVESGLVLTVAQAGEDDYRADLYDESGQRIGATSFGSGSMRGRFCNLQPALYYLYFHRSALWIDQWFDGTGSFETATPIEIAEAGQIVWRDVDLVDGGSISGRLFGPDGQPLLSAYIRVSKFEEEYGPIRGFQVTDEEGMYRVDRLGDGDYRLWVQTNALGATWYPGVADPDSAEVITIEDHADLTGIDVRFPE